MKNGRKKIKRICIFSLVNDLSFCLLVTLFRNCQKTLGLAEDVSRSEQF